ncbi:MAG: M20 family metallopeptidase [Emergencia sp.]|jgi:succinyl-diaminopimelate desuccinylase|uniref:M20 family peptidase n=1 Tax=Anaerotruncus colihominis TaxID=169435 RepID=A0A845QKG6_9FIRM|nr:MULTISPECIES: Sapep family Mn(2+)-dependent dipeptidase [Anaerotruncus]MCI9475654.1 M20 family metallopeptidase [Emergencia sp.]NBH62096.1 M20 family peptidase [Anaerotruncus colihominis]NCF02751.1 M20 family peptidase [Anaerotruncus sp. 80]
MDQMIQSYMPQVKAFFEEHREEFLNDLAEMIAIDSQRTEAKEGMPYGEGPAAALAKTLEMAEGYGLYTENWENYVGIIQLNDSKERKLEILAHLDVVPEGKGWTVTEPFVMKEVDGRVYGRGTADDKGPALAAIYALRAIKELGIPLRESVRVTVGCDEECGSSDLDYYWTKTSPAEMTFSPDADYPLINLEKGHFGVKISGKLPEPASGVKIKYAKCGTKSNVIPDEAEVVVSGISEASASLMALEVYNDTIVETDFTAENEKEMKFFFKGKSAHAADPDSGNNAATAMLQLLAKLPKEDYGMLCQLEHMFQHDFNHGEGALIHYQDDESGEISVAFTIFNIEEDGTIFAQVDSRTPISVSEKDFDHFIKRLEDAGFEVETSYSAPHYVSPDTPLVQILLAHYEDWFSEKGECIAIGGGTYVHDIPGGVAFGCAKQGVDNKMHGPDEFAEVDQLLTSGMLFTTAIADLCK